jgi:NAD(P)-dependent dehydrogenase (short-subunit alcohol dehydrogenase family)
MAVAEGMSARGAGHLVLMGRSDPSGGVSERIEELRQAGTDVVVMLGDVSRNDDVARVLTRIGAELPPLRGVVHCAGVLDDGALLKLDTDRFASVMAPKVRGSWWLHELTRYAELDFFVLFSSGSSLLGSPGQGNYAAANAFLDGLAHHRRATGLPATSINWGPWAGDGFAASNEAVDAVTRQGMELIRPEAGLRALEAALSLGAPQVGILPIADMAQFGRRHGVDLPLLAEILESATEPSPTAGPDVASAITGRLASAPEGKRRAMLLDFVRDQARQLLGLDPSQPVNPHQALSELGLDSLMAVELGNLLGAGLDCSGSLPATLLFDYPTAAAVTDYLAGEVLGWDARAEAADETTTTAEDELAEIAELSDEEAEELLLQELQLGNAEDHER